MTRLVTGKPLLSPTAIPVDDMLLYFLMMWGLAEVDSKRCDSDGPVVVSSKFTFSKYCICIFENVNLTN